MHFHTVLNRHRELSFSEKDKGTRFERLMQGYLLTSPIYENKFDKIWLWEEFPFREQFGRTDVGIDLVGLTKEGEHWAIQCKCYQEDSQIDKKHVDSFLSTSGRGFKNENGEMVRFAHRLWISTTNKWGRNAEGALINQDPPVSRINLTDLESAPIDWEKLDSGIFGLPARLAKKSIRPHQQEAIDEVHEHFLTSDRGKLIMACGTGKTYAALKIAENETGGKGTILFLVPSIALLGQTLNEWYNDADQPIDAICICSDYTVSKKKNNKEDEDVSSTVDLALPASTDVDNIARQLEYVRKRGNGGLTVFFSTYQSIAVVSKAQERIGFVFDLIVCDEAHRTTGVTLAGDDESAFVKVHDNDFLRAKKRLYMTATPRLFSDDSKSKASENDAVLCSMDDEALYGKEIHRLGFGQAVEQGLLADYKVLVLTLNDRDISPSVQRMVANEDKTINADDAAKLIGCINALSKQIVGDDGIIKQLDPRPMKRAVAFCQTINVSKGIASNFNDVSENYIADLPDEVQERILGVEAKHVDGTMSATMRDGLLSWLKQDGDECRILTNVRCLSEGVDVPSLDAVMFLAARNSQVDVVQSVGRVMRLSEGKKYGYIVIPVIIPSGVSAERALEDNVRYKVVWQVLNALRAHDDRFNATINKIELNRKRPDNILVGRPDLAFDENGNPIFSEGKFGESIQMKLQLEFEELQDTVYARMVKKVGDRQYWEQWAASVAEIAEKQIARLTNLVKHEGIKDTFNGFLSELQQNINPEISKEQAIEMLSQHMITKPVFEALFENYSFTENNPISRSMQKMIDLMEANAIEKDTESLEKFYESVRKRAAGIDNAEGKQRIIIELYDKFFKAAFPKMADQLGIVYTPVEVVDFIIHSVDDVLKNEFGRGLTDENVHILDPFTGTGTFVTRLLQSGLIRPEDLERKYSSEIHANEIVLLAYYIAAVNIENVYHDLLSEKNGYRSFDGICLTDTFQLGEPVQGDLFRPNFFPENTESVENQQKAPITVIVGNPPYSAWQKSANDDAQNTSYPELNRRIAETYAKDSTANNKNSLYDSYIKAFRWSADRLDKQRQGGIICFISNGGWLDGNAQDGFRKCLEREFSSIYVFNLRGNQRTSGELSRREGGKIFGSGSRAPIAITLLVKNPNSSSNKATIHYHDIGDYLTREEKLSKVKQFGTVANPDFDWEIIKPNEAGDWISHRNTIFGTFVPIGDKKVESADKSFFKPIYSRGLETARDAWCFNSSRTELINNINDTINYYNSNVDAFSTAKTLNNSLVPENFIDYDSTQFSWGRPQRKDINDLKKYCFDPSSVRVSAYRPFYKQNVYFNRQLNNFAGRMPLFFPDALVRNVVICIPAPGGNKDFSAIITDCIPDLHINGDSQVFPLHYFEDVETEINIDPSQSRLDIEAPRPENNRSKRDGISDFILNKARKQYSDSNISKEDIFYYVYGILHSREYRETFSSDLKKMLPRIPLVDDIADFWAFSKAGRRLADLHLSYETVPPHPDVIVKGAESGDFTVKKMRFPRKDQKDTIIFNSNIKVTGIPDKAYEYIVNGQSAIEWIMERYQVTVDKKTKIKNDPNDWAKETGNSRYILDLLLSIINLSVQTVDIVSNLPRVKFV